MAEFEVKCNTCNESLEHLFINGRYDPILEVEPCPKCLEEAKEERIEEGGKA